MAAAFRWTPAASVLLLLLLLPLAATPIRAATPARSPSASTAVFQLQGDVYPTGYAVLFNLLPSPPLISADCSIGVESARARTTARRPGRRFRRSIRALAVRLNARSGPFPWSSRSLCLLACLISCGRVRLANCVLFLRNARHRPRLRRAAGVGLV